MTRAEWRVCVDWNDDGDFTGSNEDVTDDVLGLTLDHSRDLLTDRIPAARVEMELRNSDHKYSPPNGRSPLAGNLKPGRKLWVRAAYPFDGFSDTPGRRLAAHKPDYDAGFSWSEHSGGFEIGPTGKGVRTSRAGGAGHCVATVDFGDPNPSLGCDFTRGGVGTLHGGICFRYSDSRNFLYVRVTGSAVEVRKVEAGSDGMLASGARTWGVGVRGGLQVNLHGASIRVFAGLDEVVEAESAFNVTATRHGLFSGGQSSHAWAGFGGWASLFYGGVDSILPRPGRGEQYCYVRALDEMERMGAVTLYTYASAAFPQRSDDILGGILDYAGVGAGRRQFDAGSRLVPHTFSPATWGVRALDEIYRLQDEEDGFIYVDGHGYWRLEGRGHRAGPHASAAAAIGDGSGGAGAYFSDLTWDDGVANVENVIFVRVKSYTVEGARTVWTLSETPRFAAGETKVFLAESTTYDTVVGYSPPAARVDYQANSRRNGFGRDLTSGLTVTHPNTRDFKGLGTLVSVKFGARAGYLTLLKLRGVNAVKFADPVLALAEDSASKRVYGERIKTIEARWTREVARAQATAGNRLSRKREPKTVLRVTVPNGSRANMLLILHRGLSDRVTVSYGDMGIDEDFFIEGHSLTVGEGGRYVTRELVLRGV